MPMFFCLAKDNKFSILYISSQEKGGLHGNPLTPPKSATEVVTKDVTKMNYRLAET